MPFVNNGTWPECSVGSAKPSGQPWSRCRITKRPSLYVLKKSVVFASHGNVGRRRWSGIGVPFQ